ncbi:DUF4064 domain-containing protein [Staphylococcus sp. ACRSN]|uniref:DUF4064 domain-containing protein n=1 Tax=Staphylococcus sp. ACRSN TaxID=2918214 RepID=UPI001EF3AA32|nr:DUF4064 domain-containing protein [Staphylococcus sp. ACRSN]MCG7338961.1 DUF4064 domain-containing protein [Staphylococcus sp. ACRSN]
MKRTVEKVLAWIGVALQIIGVLAIGLMIPFMGNNEFKQSAIQAMQQEDATISTTNATDGINMILGLLGFGLAYGIVVLIISLIGAILIGKKAKVAAILLIIAGVLSLLGNWINVILWIVAGIMLLVRKPNTNNDTNNAATTNFKDDLSSFDSLNKKDSNNDYKY